MRLVLFDIDGTLLLTGGVGQGSAKASLARVFGSPGRLDEFYPTGRTIEAIFVDTVLDAGFSREDYQAKREDLYEDFFEEFASRLNRNEHQIRNLPGARMLVEEVSLQEDVVVGLTTGNLQRTAMLKLAEAGFDLSLFEVGAYGNETTYRPDLVRLAHARAEALTGQNILPSQTFVIGDTARDVNSAKVFGAVSIAVATGVTNTSEVAKSSPDHFLQNLEDTGAVLDILLN